MKSVTWLCFHRPSSLDAYVFGHLAPILKSKLPNGKLQQHLKSLDNLTNFCTNILLLYFPRDYRGEAHRPWLDLFPKGLKIVCRLDPVLSIWVQQRFLSLRCPGIRLFIVYLRIGSHRLMTSCKPSLLNRLSFWRRNQENLSGGRENGKCEEQINELVWGKRAPRCLLGSLFKYTAHCLKCWFLIYGFLVTPMNPMKFSVI